MRPKIIFFSWLVYNHLVLGKKFENLYPHRPRYCVSFVVDIVKSSFRSETLIAVVLPPSSNAIESQSICSVYKINMFELLKDMQWTFLIQSANVTSHDLKTELFNPIGYIDNYILFINNRDDVDVVLKRIRRSGTWNAYAKFFVVVGAGGEEWRTFVSYILEQFWYHLAINIVVHVTDDVGSVKVSYHGVGYSADECTIIMRDHVF